MAEQAKDKGGRPTKCTPELIATFVKLMAAGNYFECACAFCGITDRTGYRWLQWGDEALDEANDELGAVPEEKQIYARFCLATREASAKAEAGLASRILEASARPTSGDWKAGAWFLEKRYQRRWGMKMSKQELSGPDGGAIPVTVVPVFAPDDPLNQEVNRDGSLPDPDDFTSSAD